MIELAVGVSRELPGSWVSAAIEEIATLSPKFDAADIGATDPVHFVPMASVAGDFGGIDVSQTRPYGDVRKGYTYFAESDVLFAKITPCMENGKGALVPPLPNKHAFGSTEFHVIRTSTAVLPKWIAHYLAQPDFRKVARRNMTGTAGQMRVPSSWLASIGVPLAPIAEQTRIVEKLEELLSDLDAGVAELKAAQRKLAQYRQSLIKAAVEGALTADWRAAKQDSARSPCPSSSRLSTAEGLVKRGSIGSVHQGKLDSRVRGNDEQKQNASTHETGADLLQRILTERRARWQQKQLARFAEQGKTPPNGWQSKYPEPVAPDTTDLPALPEDWVWASGEQICDFITKGTTPPKDMDARGTKTVPFLRVTNLTSDGSLDFTDRVFVSDKTHQGFLARSTVFPGDVLMNIVGPPLGQVSVVTEEFEQWNINQAIAIFRPLAGFLSSFVCAALLSTPIQQWLKKRAKTTAGQANLTLEVCRGLPLPVPPSMEQMAIVELLDVQLGNVLRQGVALDLALKQAAAQRKNILKAAFAGQLVPQDPNDEPASVLLERIRADRAARGGIGSKRGHKSRGA